jgi:hypothetical protein
MSRIAILKRSISTAVAALALVGLLSPANAAYQNDTVAVFPDLPISKTADHASMEPTSHRPWLAPVGHRQPQQADVPQYQDVSSREREQQRFDEELDRKLIICRGC